MTIDREGLGPTGMRTYGPEEERKRLGMWKTYMQHNPGAISRSQQALRSYGKVKMPKLSFLKEDEE